MHHLIGPAGWALFIAMSLGWAVFCPSLGWSTGTTLFSQAILSYVLLAAAERMAPNRHDWRWWHDRQGITDIAHAIINDQLARSLLTIATFLLVDSVMPETPPHEGMVFVGILVIEAGEYARHRLMHRLEMLWPFHAVHHHPRRMHVLRSGRVHFVDGASRALFVFAPALALGIPADAITWWIILLNAIGPISHSNLDIRTPAILNRLVVTPMVHQVHHADNAMMMTSNLAPITPVFDILFGTWCAPEKHPVNQVGVSPDPLPGTLAGQLLEPFRSVFGKSTFKP